MTSPSSFPSTGYNNFTDYTTNGRASVGGGAVPQDGYWSIDKCKKAYSQYIANKSQEIEEQKNARRYYHGVHWTSEQVKELNKRKQPIVTFNRIARKINGVVGLIDRLKQDPKAYPRTPQGADGAELGHRDHSLRARQRELEREVARGRARRLGGGLCRHLDQPGGERSQGWSGL